MPKKLVLHIQKKVAWMKFFSTNVLRLSLEKHVLAKKFSERSDNEDGLTSVHSHKATDGQVWENISMVMSITSNTNKYFDKPVTL